MLVSSHRITPCHAVTKPGVGDDLSDYCKPTIKKTNVRMYSFHIVGNSPGNRFNNRKSRRTL